jgi:hypothetical protein
MSAASRRPKRRDRTGMEMVFLPGTRVACTFIDAAPCSGAQNSARGDPGKTRTSDKQFRKLLLYPPELRGHDHHCPARPVYRKAGSDSVPGYGL